MKVKPLPSAVEIQEIRVAAGAMDDRGHAFDAATFYAIANILEQEAQVREAARIRRAQRLESKGQKPGKVNRT